MALPGANAAAAAAGWLAGWHRLALCAGVCARVWEARGLPRAPLCCFAAGVGVGSMALPGAGAACWPRVWFGAPRPAPSPPLRSPSPPPPPHTRSHTLFSALHGTWVVPQLVLGLSLDLLDLDLLPSGLRPSCWCRQRRGMASSSTRCRAGVDAGAWGRGRGQAAGAGSCAGRRGQGRGGRGQGARAGSCGGRRGKGGGEGGHQAEAYGLSGAGIPSAHSPWHAAHGHEAASGGCLVRLYAACSRNDVGRPTPACQGAAQRRTVPYHAAPRIAHRRSGAAPWPWPVCTAPTFS